MTTLVEPSSEGGCTSNSQIPGSTTIDNQLASEEVALTFFLLVGYHTGLLGVTVEHISSGEICTRHRTGEEGGMPVVAA
jgi:hypothetical protein